MANPDKRKLLAVADRAASQTVGGRLRWGPTDIDGRFTSPLNSGSLAIEQLDDNLYWFAVLIDDGARLEEVTVRSDSFYYVQNDAGAGMDRLASVVPELYDLARRDALNVDQAIDSILKELS